MASLLHNHLREQGVELLLKADVTGFEETLDTRSTALADGRVLESDLVMLSIGVAPESTLAREAGLEARPAREHQGRAAMRTSDPDIYAVGDAVEVTNVVTGSPTLIALAGPANERAVSPQTTSAAARASAEERRALPSSSSSSMPPPPASPSPRHAPRESTPKR